MIIDNKGKLFGKVSIVDVLVVLIVLLVVGGIGYKFKASKSVVLGNPEKVTIEFYSEEAPDFALKAVKIGDVVGDYEKGAVFGKVVSISIDKAKSVGQSSSGQFVEASKPGFASAKIVVDGEGFLNSTGGVAINNADYFIGRQIITKAGNSVFVSRIYDIKKKG